MFCDKNNDKRINHKKKPLSELKFNNAKKIYYIISKKKEGTITETCDKIMEIELYHTKKKRGNYNLQTEQ